MLQRCVITGLQVTNGRAARGAAARKAGPAARGSAAAARPGSGAGATRPGSGAGATRPDSGAGATRRRDHVEAIHAALAACGPQTIHELAARTRLTHVQVARRLPEMHGQAEVTSELRAGPQGRRCRVWRIAVHANAGSAVNALAPLLQPPARPASKPGPQARTRP